MTDNLNLELDFVPEGDAASGRQREAVARVYLSLASGYLKSGGQPAITSECTSFEEFAREVGRLKNECDAILAEAATRFDVSDEPGTPVAPKAPSSAGAGSLEALAGKTPLRLEQDLCVSDRMTRDVQTLHANDKLTIADELMKAGHFRHVVVVDEGRGEVLGVVTQRDIFYGALAWSLGQGAAAHQKTLDALPVKNVMRSEVTTVAPDTPLGDAARTLLEGRIGCLPVVEDGRLVGILTEGDFLAMMISAGQPS